MTYILEEQERWIKGNFGGGGQCGPQLHKKGEDAIKAKHIPGIHLDSSHCMFMA